ncbi:predicted protein [Uncinocarpus reesii 1704]|uniref:Uncharacterized protein n=1 Tax=Uncinocarpus reesii (strain UAMH 1704) TaxID=336963 RepID=C4JIB1_UNCRE|nr:uncharacterized protein UREG_02857 [Uncinocarpus reesii 1704]EEP78008.1 predicted protein [Uncinocarpus reesii 1704]
MNASTTSSRRNPLTTYLRLLHRSKTTLPHGQLICVSASPNISTMDSLLRLACAVGPYIAVLQVHADIIDDWSVEAVRRLTNIAKRLGFLVWEGGRILNTKRRPTGQHPLSGHEIARDIAMARKRYTKGISVAAWAALASTWVIGPEEHSKGGSQLIPTLRRAARETVSRTTMSVRTEISGGQTPSAAGTSMDDCRDDLYDDEEQDQDLLSTTLGGLNISPPLRKASVISLTRTITQHAELSKPLVELEDSCGCDEIELAQHNDQDSAAATALPPPPVLSRGIVICLPSDSQSTPRQRQAAIALGRAHSDFVVGFVTEESWINARKDLALANSLQDDDDGEDDDDDDEEEDGESLDEVETYAVFSPLENDHVGRGINVQEPLTGEDDGLPELPKPSHPQSGFGTKAQQIFALHQLVAQALSIQTGKSTTGSPGPSGSKKRGVDILYIPVITMNL